MGADFVNATYSRVRAGEIEVMAVVEIDADRLRVSLTREDGSALTRDEEYAVTLLLHRGRLEMRRSARNVYEVRA